MRRKCIMLIFVIFLNTFLSTSCWNYRDIESYSIVMGYAIDKNKSNDKFLLTVELMDFEMSGKEAKQTSKIVESEGDTFFDAIRNMINITGKRLYWSHANIVIFSEDIARDYLLPSLDLIYRDPEMREEIYVIISKEKTAGELLKQETMTAEQVTTEIYKMLKGQKSLGKAPTVQAFEFINDVEDEGISGILPAIKIVTNSGKSTDEIDGTAIFKYDHLVGYLSKEETKYLLFVLDSIDRGLIIQPTSDKEKATLEILNTKTKLKPEQKDGQITMNINIEIQGNIAEIGIERNYIGKEGRETLKKSAEASLKASIEELIKKVQQEYKTDIFGFGKQIRADMPNVWKSAGKDWDSAFENVEVNVKVNIELANSGLVNKEIEKR